MAKRDILDRLRAHDGEKIGFVREAIQEIERLRKLQCKCSARLVCVCRQQ